MSGTQLAPISAEQFRARIAALIPSGWCGDDAKSVGTEGAILRAMGGGLSLLVQEIQYLLSAARYPTSTAPELDLASQDFFGSGLPRPPGMNDETFAALILQNLFQSAATRPAISAALTSLTGSVPRMLEPWSIFDTGVWGRVSYWNVDTAANPARWGSPGTRYQGFIETVSPQIPTLGASVPIYGWGAGPLGPYWNVPGYFFGIIPSSTGTPVVSLVERLRATGTTIWLKIVSQQQLGTVVRPTAPQSLVAVPSQTSVQLTWQAPAQGSAPIQYQVLFRVLGSQALSNGPTTGLTTVALTGLQPFVTYEVVVQATNQAGFAQTSPPLQVQTTKQPPSPVSALQATIVQATAVTLLWQPPAQGTGPFVYTVQYRVTGTVPFSTFPVSAGAVGVTVIGLQPSTEYDFEVIASTT